MTNTSLNIYHQFSQDFNQHEVLLVGEYGGKTLKWAYPVPTPMTDKAFADFIKNLNSVALEDFNKNVNSVDATP